MNTFILLICKGLDVILNWFILALFVYETYLGAKSWSILSGLKKRINKLNEPKVKKGRSFRRNRGEIETHYEGTPVKKWEDLDSFLKDYQNKGKTYTAFSLIIQLFTLLGILGTVAGLFVALQDMEDASNLLDGVGFALSSTILGIICAVIFKVFDIFLVSRYITYIDEGIERYEKDFDINSSDALFNAMTEKDTNTKLDLDEEKSQ